MYVLVQQLSGLANEDTSKRLVISLKKSIPIFQHKINSWIPNPRYKNQLD